MNNFTHITKADISIRWRQLKATNLREQKFRSWRAMAVMILFYVILLFLFNVLHSTRELVQKEEYTSIRTFFEPFGFMCKWLKLLFDNFILIITIKWLNSWICRWLADRNTFRWYRYVKKLSWKKSSSNSCCDEKFIQRKFATVSQVPLCRTFCMESLLVFEWYISRFIFKLNYFCIYS